MRGRVRTVAVFPGLFLGAFGNTYVTWHSRYNLDLEDHSTMRPQNNLHCDKTDPLFMTLWSIT